MNQQIKPGCPLIVKVLAGIGDWCWLATKLPLLKDHYAIPYLGVCVHSPGSHRDGRAVDFIRRFKWVDEVWEGGHFRIFDDDRMEIDNRYNYLANGYVNDKWEYSMMFNGHLEAGRRIEELYPEVPTNWDIFSEYEPHKADWLEGEDGYAVVVPGCRKENRSWGWNHNGTWTPENWVEVIRGLPHKVVLLGASYDRDYVDDLASMAGGVLNLAGKTTTPDAIDIMRRARVVLGYGNGMTIASTFLGTPTVRFWGTSYGPNNIMGFHEDFATAWVPPGTRSATAWYEKDTPESVLETVKTITQ